MRNYYLFCAFGGQSTHGSRRCRGVNEVYEKMLNGQFAENFEAEAKRKFIEESAQMKLFIVVDKLLGL